MRTLTDTQVATIQDFAAKHGDHGNVGLCERALQAGGGVDPASQPGDSTAVTAIELLPGGHARVLGVLTGARAEALAVACSGAVRLRRVVIDDEITTDGTIADDEADRFDGLLKPLGARVDRACNVLVFGLRLLALALALTGCGGAVEPGEELLASPAPVASAAPLAPVPTLCAPSCVPLPCGCFGQAARCSCGGVCYVTVGEQHFACASCEDCAAAMHAAAVACGY